MKQIFLAYASREKSSARDITLALRGRGFLVFLDEDNLHPAGEYHQRIQMAVAQSDAVVFLLIRSDRAEVCSKKVETPRTASAARFAYSH